MELKKFDQSLYYNAEYMQSFGKPATLIWIIYTALRILSITTVNYSNALFIVQF